MSGGLLIAGHIVEIPGLTIDNPTTLPWCKLDPGDYHIRREQWIRQIILHTTKGIWPQHVIPGAGPYGAGKIVADFWRGDPTHSAAQLVIDRNGSVACLVDLAGGAAYHATVSNEFSIGIEMYQERDGGIYEAVLDAAAKLVPALCEALSIPFQVSVRAYNNAPIPRMVHGGADMVGVFGHRDNTSQRGHGDPGDEVFRRLIAAGAEPFDYTMRGDIAAWKLRQSYLNATFGEQLTVDGVCGHSTIGAMRRHGFARGLDIPA